jgi:hypothetical protein
LPAIERFETLILGHVRLETTIHAPEALHFLDACPHSLRDPSQKSRAKGSRFNVNRPNDGFSEYICLELHKKIINSGAAIHSQFAQRFACVRFHRVDEIFALEGYTFKGRPYNVRFRTAARQATD